MKEYKICTSVSVKTAEELSPQEQAITEAAKDAAASSYSPYSHFAVGAALRLEGGEIVTGSNQENASYPVGCCAERTALHWTAANHLGVRIEAIAIAAKSGGHFTSQPIAPCGMCRQALLEAERRQGSPVRVILYGTEGIHLVRKIEDLLPLSFNQDAMSI